jgi:hypothetical protein
MVNDDKTNWGGWESSQDNNNNPIYTKLTESSAGFENDTSFSTSSPYGNLDGWLSGNPNMTYVTNVKLMGSKSTHVYANTVCQTTDCGGVYAFRYTQHSANQLYWAGYVMFHGSWPTIYQKFFLTDGPNQLYFQPECGGNYDSHGNPTHFIFLIQRTLMIIN